MTKTSAAPENNQVEPKQVYINDVLIRLEEAFPGTAEDEMPIASMSDGPEPSELPQKS